MQKKYISKKSNFLKLFFCITVASAKSKKKYYQLLLKLDFLNKEYWNQI